jgi:tRNA (cytidine/uridine-2'-O-)-methyltransferase
MPSCELHVALVSPEIHWNTGNAGRTCLAGGAHLHLIEPLGFGLGEREVRRAGLDYWERVQPRVWPDWQTFEAQLPELGQPFIFTASAHRTYWQPDYPERTVLIFGSESTGLPDSIRVRHAANAIRIPMATTAGVRALNLSTAVALGVYEVLRQRATALVPGGG